MKKSLSVFLSVLGLGMGLMMITSHFSTPELGHSMIRASAAFLVFFIFVVAVLSLGGIIRHRLHLTKPAAWTPSLYINFEAMIEVLMGSVAFYLLAYLMTAFGLFQGHVGWISWIVIAIMISKGISHVRLYDFFKNHTWGYLSFFPFMIVFLRTLEGFQIPTHGDQYLSYLIGPRLWADTGGFHSWQNYSQLFLATSYESLFSWGSVLMGLSQAKGLDASQFFSQWCVGGIGTLGLMLASGFLLHLLISSESPVDADHCWKLNWIPVGVVMALQIPSVRWTANLAKNDFGIMFWGTATAATIIGLTQMTKDKTHRWAWIFAGLTLGATVIGKLPMASLAIALGIFLLLLKEVKGLFWLILGAVIAVIPVLIRNEVVTGNPVFPWFNSLFQSPWISAPFQQGSQHATAFHWDPLKQISYLKEFFWDNPYVIFLPFCFAYMKAITLRRFLWISILSILIFNLAFRPTTEIRYQNTNLVLVMIFSSFGLFLFLNMFFQVKIFSKKWIMVIPALLIVATSSITFFSLFQIGTAKYGTLIDRLPSLVGGEGKSWILKNIPRSKSLLFFGDMHWYYLVGYPSKEGLQDLAWGEKLQKEPLNNVITEALKNASYDYLYLASDLSTWHRMEEMKQAMTQTLMSVVSEKKVCLLFQGQHSQVWDLKCYQKQN